MKLFLIMGLLGHILCGISDLLLSRTPNGKVSLTDFRNYEKASASFRNMPLKNLSLALLLGVAAMILELFGYTRLCDYVRTYSSVHYWVMLSAALVMFVAMPLHHTICCLCEWFFVRLGCTKEALDSVWNFFQSTAYTMYLAYLSWVVFSAAFLLAVAGGATGLPRWAAIFNPLPLAVLVLPTKLPAKANVIGAGMFLGLLFLL